MQCAPSGWLRAAVSRVILLALLLSIVLSAPGHTAALYTGAASATVTIENLVNLTLPGSLAGLSITGEVGTLHPGPTTTGQAFATTTGSALIIGDPASLGLDAGVFLEAIVTGDSVAGFAGSLHTAEALLVLANTSNATFEITLAFTYDLLVEALVLEPLTQLAQAHASVLIASVIQPPVISTLLADSLFGGGAFTASEVGTLTLQLAPGGLTEVSVAVDVDGYAAATTAASATTAVPEPTSLALVSIGLLSLVAVTWYRPISSRSVL